jgi:hypothetical protein
MFSVFVALGTSALFENLASSMQHASLFFIGCRFTSTSEEFCCCVLKFYFVGLSGHEKIISAIFHQWCSAYEE